MESLDNDNKFLKATSSKTSLSSATITTTISKHELHQQQQQIQQQRYLKTTSNNLVINYNAHAIANVTSAITATSARTTSAATTTTTTASIDSATTIILIDSINNNSNNNNNNNVNTNFNGRAATAITGMTVATCITTPTATYVELPRNTSRAVTPNGNTDVNGSNVNRCTIIGDTVGEIIEIERATADTVLPQPTRTQKRRSLLNFKSFDFHLKSFYTGLRSKNSQSQSSSLGGGNTGSITNVSGGISTETPSSNTNSGGNGCRRAATIHNRMPPYLKIEAVDTEESENLLLDYPQSPYSSRRNSSPQDNNRSSSQLLHIDRYDLTRSQATSPSPYFLSPYVTDSGNIRRSSTSDITSCKRSGSSSVSDSRRPSTSDLLRRARERRGSEARMGRSVSHSGLPRGGRAGHGGGGGRRTSIAF